MVIREQSREVAIKRLRTYIGRMERRYECSSGFMLEAVKLGKERHTAEISKWLMKYNTLQELQRKAPPGSTTGTHTTTI